MVNPYISRCLPVV